MKLTLFPNIPTLPEDHILFTTKVIVRIMFFSLTIATLLFIIGLFFQVATTDMILLALIGSIFSAIGYVLVEKGYWRVARLIPCAIIVFLSLVDIYLYGIGPTSGMEITIFAILVTLLFHPKAQWFGIAIAISTSTAMGYFSPNKEEFSGIIILEDTIYWGLLTIIYFLILTFLLRLFSIQFFNALNKANSLAKKLKKDLRRRRRSQKKLTMLNDCLLHFGDDPINNMNELCKLTGKLLDAHLVAYHQYINDTFITQASWNIPANQKTNKDMSKEVCEKTVHSHSNTLLIYDAVNFPELFSHSSSNLNIGLVSVAAQKILFEEKVIGCICVGFTKENVVTEEDRRLIGIIASALAVEQSRYEADNHIRTSEEKYRTVFNSSSDAILLYDYPSGKILDCNEKALELYGYEKKDLIGNRIGESSSGNLDYTQENLQKLIEPMAKADSNWLEWEVKTSNGKIKWIELNIRRIEINEETKLITIERDITERKREIFELIEAKKQSEEARKVKEELFVHMSHELRTPMNAVIGIINILNNTTLSQDQEKYIHALQLSADNVLKIINDILDFSKADSKMVTFQKEVMNIHTVIRNVVKSIAHQAESKNLLIRMNFDDRIPTYIIGDTHRTSQIVLNLVSNAIKFTHEGHIQIETQVSKSTAKTVFINILVSDTGIGIPKSKLDSIFESFTQADNKINREYGGTGLGLAIVKRLVEAQNGTISVSSRVNKGSTFTITIPFKIATGDMSSHASKELPYNNYSLQGVSVLLVEDNKFNQLVAETMLKEWNVHTDVAVNGELALKKLKENMYDVILMDLQMPKVDGYSAAKLIRTSLASPQNSIPIIAMSAHTLETEKKKARDAGMDDYIVKPFTPEELHEKISKYLKNNEYSR